MADRAIVGAATSLIGAALGFALSQVREALDQRRRETDRLDAFQREFQHSTPVG